MSDPITPSEQPSPKAVSGIGRRDAAARELLESCTAHFGAPRYEVTCDVNSIVWVKDNHDKRSVGLQPWLLRDHTLEEILDRADAKLGVHVGRS